MYIASQILVFIADGFYAGSMLAKRKNLLTILLFCSDVLFATHYLLLGGTTGAVTIFIDAVYLATIFLLEKFNKQKFSLIPTIIAMILVITFGIITWQGAISLLPMCSILIYLTGMIFTKVFIVKGGALIRNILNIIYMMLITSYLGACLEFVLMLTALIGIILSVRNYKNQ